MEVFLMQLFNGISVSSILLLAALGLAITFGLMGVINMAHGEFIMTGAYTAYVVQNLFQAALPAGMLDWLIECARVTPCGGNAQALRFAVAESPEACAAVFPALKWAGMLTDWDGPEAGERPTGYVAILGEAGTRAKLNAIDAGIAAQTIQLAAYTRDLGCCIFLSFDPRKIREVLGIPENLEPLLVLALGFQKEVRRVETVGADGSVKYWRDAQGVHHVPKRPLEDLLILKK